MRYKYIFGFMIPLIMSMIFWITPTHAEEVVGKCACVGKVSAGLLLPNNIFDGYCPNVKAHCSSCGGGKADCAIDLDLTKTDCDKANNDPWSMVKSVGVDASLKPLLNIVGTCKWSKPVVGDGCAAKADQGQVALVELQTSDSKAWSCQDVPDKGTQSKCVTSPACVNGQFCCAAGIGSVGGGAAPAPAGSPPAAQAQSSIWIPQYLLNCMDVGSCTLDQIVATAAAFANFLFGISGAVALAILVYGGFRYLVSAGRTEEVTHAKQMIVSAAIGLVIIFGANALIRFVLLSFTRQTAKPTACESRPGFSCQVIQGGSKKDVAKSAKALGCEDASQNLCAAPDQGVNVFCCPLEPPK